MAKTVSNKKIYKKIKKASVLGAIVSFLFFLSLAIVIMLASFYTENDHSIIYVPEEDDAVSVSVLSIPVWMSVDMRDIFLLLEIVLMISVLILLLVMVMFVKAISSVLR